MFSEDNVTGRILPDLVGKETLAKWKLAQMPQDVKVIIPPLSLYLQAGFKIERADQR